MSSEVHRLFLKHPTTSKQLADTLTNEGHGDGLVHIRIVRKGSHFPGKTCNAFVTYELESCCCRTGAVDSQWHLQVPM